MKRSIGYIGAILIVSLALVAGSSARARAAQAVLAWNAASDPSVTGYNVYFGTQSGNYQTPVNAGGSATYTVTNLSASQTCYFAVTAYSSATESAFSQELACNFITAQAGANGQITPAGVSSVAGGGSQTYSIVPNPGYQIALLEVDGQQVSPTATYTFSNVTSCHTISVTFSPVNSPVNFTISAQSQAGGAISPSGPVSVAPGANQTYTISPAANYAIATVTVDGASVGAVSSYTFNGVESNHTIAAAFSPIQSYTISTSFQGGGSISPAGSVIVISGNNAQFAITANTGYQVSNVVVDGKSVGAVSSYTFTGVCANHSIQASFASQQCVITASAQGSGTISPSGANPFSSGTNVSYSMTPASGYTLSAVLVDGNQVSSGQTQSASAKVGGGAGAVATNYTFQNVAGDHTIEALFSPTSLVVADAGPDQVVKSGATVTLDGLNSTASGGRIASYKWTQVLGPSVALSNPSSPQCTFTPQNISSAASLGFALTVTNAAGVSSSSTCLVNVSSTGKGPAVNAGPDQTVSAYTNVTLDGSSYSDSYGTIATYAWTQISGPTVSILNADTPNGSFVAPDPGAGGETLVFELSVQDQYGLEARGLWTVNVVGDSQPPVANAGDNLSAVPMSTVTLKGTGSLDPTGSPDTYRWTQISGVPVTLSDPTSAAPTFTAPTWTTDQGAQLVFMLTVTNPVDQLSATAQCTVTVQNTSPVLASVRPNWSFASGFAAAKR
ncbi:MAG: hypothetical protein P4L43_21275 [Syntrophobacteraceae bacterium]|nr:hypothetical protein [Syntrophobacteraceae bacterium]